MLQTKTCIIKSDRGPPGYRIPVQSKDFPQASVEWKRKLNPGVSKNGGTPKSSILTGFSIINYKPSIFGVALFLGNIHIVIPLCGNRITILLGKKSPHPARMPQSKRTAMVLLSIGLGCSGGLSEAKVEVRCLTLGGSWFGCFQK